MAEHQEPLFDPADFPPAPPAEGSGIAPLTHALWTEHKAALIRRYLYYFIQITKHGTYIDGFAGPQNKHHHDTMWAAKRVIEIEPAWLRRFHFVELDANKIPLLEGLKTWEDAQPRKPRRQVSVYPGDFNVVVDQILEGKSITPKEATFCLLDQRTFECHWSSVAKLAAYKPKPEHKIELFYFLAMGWLDRSLKATTKNIKRLDDWWGGPGWTTLLTTKRPSARAQLFAQRFRDELGYAHADAWPIYKRQSGGTIMYYMVHASDHPEARKLMRRAYSRAVDPLEPPEQLAFELGIG